MKRLLTASDTILTDGKKFQVHETWDEALKAQDLEAYNNPNTPIYLMKVASIQVFTKKQVKLMKEVKPDATKH